MSDREQRANGTPEIERRDAGPTQDFGYRVRTKIELRSAGEGSKMPGLGGYTAMFDSWSERLGIFEDFREKIRPGAFKKTIAENDIRGLFDHSTLHVLGRSKGSDGGTMKLNEDSEGLEFDIPELPDTTDARNLVELVERGDVDGCSFGFYVVRAEWDYEPDASGDAPDDVDVTRELIEVRLFDVGPVTFPAYPETSAEVRSKAADLRARRAASRGDGKVDERFYLRSYRHRLRELEAHGGRAL